MQRGLAVPGSTPRLFVALLTAALAALGTSSVLAQTAAPKSLEDMERAQRDADKVFKMILINSDAPRKKRREEAAALAASGAPTGPATASAAPKPQSQPLAVAPARAEAAAPAPATLVAAAPAAALPTPGSAAAVLAAPASAPAAAADEEDDEDDSPLIPTVQVKPTYRAALLREIGKGTVRVKFEVQPDGSVAKQEVVSSSNRGLNSATLAAIGQWKFQPIKKPRQAQVELGFTLEQ